MKIVVLAGGISTERAVSLVTGTGVCHALRENGHRAILVDLFLGLEEVPADLETLFDAPDGLCPVAKIEAEAPDLETVKRGRKDQGPSHIGPHVLDICQKADLVFLGEDQVYEGMVLRPFPRDMAYIGTVTDRRQLYKIVFQDGWYNPLWKKVPALSLLPREDHPEFYPVRFGEDLLQSIPLYRDCRKAVFLADSLYNYTQNPNSATNGLGYEKYRVTSLVPETCWNFLNSQNVWNSEDFEEYMGWLRRLTRFQIWLVAKFATSAANRCALLKAISQDDFYAKIIATAPKEDRCLTLMQKGRYRALCTVGTAMRKLGDVRRWVRKKLP